MRTYKEIVKNYILIYIKIYDFAPSGPDGAKIIGIFLR